MRVERIALRSVRLVEVIYFGAPALEFSTFFTVTEAGTSKVMLKVILNRLKPQAEEIIA